MAITTLSPNGVMGRAYLFSPKVTAQSIRLCLKAVQIHTAGAQASEAFHPGSIAKQQFIPGAVAAQTEC